MQLTSERLQLPFYVVLCH